MRHGGLARTARTKGAASWVVLALAACAPVPVPVVTYACQGGVQLQVRFVRDQALAKLPGGGDVTLVQQPSASGFWYAGDGHVLRGKGRQAQWAVGDAEPVACLVFGP